MESTRILCIKKQVVNGVPHLGNINPKYRTKLAAIRLLAVARSAELRQSGVDVILNRIKEDMDALYSGVKMQTINGEKTIYGAIVSLCGDTLAQHELAGFKEGVGFAYSKCRHCECSFDRHAVTL
jgi:hypothetical protein